MSDASSESSNIPSPPTVKGLPFIGSALQTLGDPRPFLLQQAQQLGPIFRLKALHIDYVMLVGAAANEFVNQQGRDFFQSKDFWRGMMHELEADNFLIGLDGEEHTALRKMFKADFSKSALEGHEQELHDLCVAMFADIEVGQSFEVVERVLQLTSQMIACVMTGAVPNREELSSFLYYINEITNHYSLRRLPSWILRFRFGRFKQAKKATLTFAERVVAEKVSGKNSLHNFVDSVMQAAEQCPHLFAQGDVRFSAILPLFAGIDTLGQTLNYALFELHRDANSLALLQAEIDTAFADGIPTIEQLKAMPILSAVIMETLRLHPSAFGMVRTANRDFEFAGCSVKKGQDVVILTTATHHMDDYFKAPERFDIQRFMPPRNEHRQRNVYAPFGRGPHVCLGAGMAESMMALALGSILYHYEFAALDPNIRYKERISPTPSLGKQFHLCLQARRR